ncbi:M15 family metallopeptidase [Rheinheimera texasensis]|uniref:M15 family metallopeptidase n=1 Tax=Rheinheimera texasensis TaxID=306205 RepID=UPI0004E22A74|nr:M15 family metallopeptidase [Rheinheimera texasensis]
MALVDLTARQLTGLDAPGLVEAEPGRFLQPAVAAAYQAMQQAAAADGITLRIASGWRDFSRQQAIFKAKLNGERPVYDAAQQAVTLAGMSLAAKLHAIMLYSALPGASRHHWGTDLDVWDQAAVPADYVLQLSAAEYAPDGPFARLSVWLSQHAGRFGFFRPYRSFRGGVAVEPWHLSYRPLASLYLQQLSLPVLQAAILQSELAEPDEIAAMLPELYQRYICNIDGENDD